MPFVEDVFLNMLLKFCFEFLVFTLKKFLDYLELNFATLRMFLSRCSKVFFSFFLFSLFFYNYFETIYFPVTTWNIYFHGFEKLLPNLNFFLRFRTFFSILKIFSRFWKKVLFFKKIFFVERFGFHKYLFCGKQS